MTEDKRMIPLSVIDAQIKEVEELAQMATMDYAKKWVLIAYVKPMLEEIKKEASPSPIEQKIKDRIAFLEPMSLNEPLPDPETYIHDDMVKTILIQERIDELRKLLE